MSEPKCVGMYSLFDASDLASHVAAKAICKGCDFIVECAGILGDVQESSTGGAAGRPSGTWAGQLIGRLETDRTPKCGTDGGYYMHNRHGERACEPCLKARREAERARAAKKRLREAS